MPNPDCPKCQHEMARQLDPEQGYICLPCGVKRARGFDDMLRDAMQPLEQFMGKGGADARG